MDVISLECREEAGNVEKRLGMERRGKGFSYAIILFRRGREWTAVQGTESESTGL